MSGVTTHLCFTINGRPVEFEISSERTLLAVIREDLGLLGTKEGCSQGHCGSCSVLVDGNVVLSCRTKATAVDGKEVLTIEGLGTREHPHPLQRAFVETGAVQCGFCSPGVIVSAKALLDRNAHPTQEDILSALNRNLCRCTGYVKMVDAVWLAAEYMRRDVAEGSPSSPSIGAGTGRDACSCAPRNDDTGSCDGQRIAIGRSYPRRDAWDKVLGVARFGADLAAPGLHHGVVVRSPHARARVMVIRAEAALAVPGVVAVLTSRDIPGRNGIGVFRSDQPILAEVEVRHVGEAVALVVAEDVAAAEAGRDLVEVEYEVLPALRTVEEALAEGAPRVHDDVPNEVFSRRLVHGDADAAFSSAAVVIQGHFTTPYNEHAYLEPEAGVALTDEDRLTVIVGTQSAQYCRSEIAMVLAVEPQRVRVVQATTGGAFGGKLDALFPGLLALAAYVTRKPVRIVLSREESFLATAKRHPFAMDLRIASTLDGRIIGLKMDFTANTGAYLSFGAGVVTRAAIHATGPYRIPNVDVVGRAVHTHGPVSGAMRGFGVPQVLFAVESVVDELARKLDIDPLVLRRMNGFRPFDCTSSGQRLEARASYLATLDAVAPIYDQARERAAAYNASSEAKGRIRRRGVGIASMWFGLGKTSLPEKSSAFLELQADGKVRLVTTAADVGQGLDTVMAQIVAEELCMSYEDVLVSTRDTDGSPDGGFTSASRQTYNTGNAVLGAASLLKDSVRQAGAEMLDSPAEEMVVKHGAVHACDNPRRRVTFAELVAAGHTRSYSGAYTAEVTEIDDHGQGEPYETYTFGTQVVEVEVDMRSGKVRVRKVWVAHDVGTVINPQAVEGQLEGGVFMGIGFALREEFIPGTTLNFGTYSIPRSRDAPLVRVLPLETPHERGPFGAAGAGECALMPTAPAIANAIFDAVQVRARDLPVTPGRLRALFDQGSAAAAP